MASSAGSIEGSTGRGRGKSPWPDGSQDRAEVVSLEGRLAGEQAIERGAQAVDVGARAEAVEVAGRLLGAHISRRAQRRAGQRIGRSRWPRRASASARPTADPGPPSRRLGQAPVDDERLAIFADDDVGRLDIAVEHAPAVGVVDGVADVDEPAQQLAQAPASAGPGRRSSLRSAWKAPMASLRLSPRMNRMA